MKTYSERVTHIHTHTHENKDSFISGFQSTKYKNNNK